MKLHLLCFLLCLSLHVTAQENIKPVFCGNEIFSDIIRKNYPDLQKDFESTFQSIHSAHSLRTNEPLDVNVVVHIIWNAPEENLDDSIVQNQILILNNDYNRLNADSAKLRSLFRPEAGNANIHFHLASVVRVQTDAIFEVDILGNNLLSAAKHDADGGSDAWDPDAYLNIWVCKIQPITFLGVTVGQILGFAFPPDNLANWPAGSSAPSAGEDGVVIDYRVFGSNNPNPIENPDGTGNITIKGRTPVHEVGHYFGLRHIWGDGGLLGPNACDQSDGVDDTPYANSQSAFDCDTSKNSCLEIEPHYNKDVPDLIENYMDYASEDCMNMFTHGQVELMRNTLQGPRSGLLEPFSAVTPIDPIQGFYAFPNPSEGSVTISLDLIAPTDLDLSIRSLDGKLMYARTREYLSSGQQSIHLDLHSAASGVYIVELLTEGTIHSQKIVVR